MPTNDERIIQARLSPAKPAFAQARIDWTHPLARYLKTFFLFNEAQGLKVFDLVNPAIIGTMGAGFAWGTGPYGVHVVSPNTSLRSIQTAPDPVTNGPNWSLEVVINMITTPGVGGTVAGDAAGTNAVFVSTANKMGIVDPSSGSASETTAMTNGVWYHEVVSVNTGTSTASFFRNGQANGSGTSFADASVTFTDFLGSTPNASNQINAKVALLRLWNVALTQQQASLLYEAPFELLRNLQDARRTYAIMGGSPAAAGNAIAGEADGTATGTTLSIRQDQIAGESDGTGTATALTIRKDQIAGEADGTGAATALSIRTDQIAGEADGVGTATALSIRKDQITGSAQGSGSLTTLTLTVTGGTIPIAGTASGTGAGSSMQIRQDQIAGETDGSGVATALSIRQAQITAEADGSGVATALAIRQQQIAGTTLGTGTASTLRLRQDQIAGSVNAGAQLTALQLTVQKLIAAQASGVGTALLSLTVTQLVLIGATVGASSRRGPTVTASDRPATTVTASSRAGGTVGVRSRLPTA